MLKAATLIRRYKRFLADIQLDDGEILTIHCPNTGSMKNCAFPGSRIWYSKSNNKNRKYPHTWELIETPAGHLIGVNTGKANRLVREAIESGVVEELTGYADIRAEVRYGVDKKSRVDFVLSNESGSTAMECYVEVKSVTLLDETCGEGVGLFPDAVSERGTRHLNELMHVARNGQRAVLFFCVQHTGIGEVRPADDIDPVYGQTLRKALVAGVEVLAYRADIKPGTMALRERLTVVCP
jgi:sugar fermentation stimulation protein A